ncbi:uncharacterized protein N7479_011197 [Penicillium vulpinum]|uniref:uncharacterized protein n=1 Tax=Penicillium vulpinum TaxID=29845 RepID=UPI0025491D2C|nr:uncharacterized protein N7479_011197 [Penicillium vulpinum]KAJ5952784.1 hypothetical protein N7479_011197 [Penicillium vulpinum]
MAVNEVVTLMEASLSEQRSESESESDYGKVEIEPCAYVIALSATTKRMELSRLRALMPGATTDSCYSKYDYQPWRINQNSGMVTLQLQQI